MANFVWAWQARARAVLKRMMMRCGHIRAVHAAGRAGGGGGAGASGTEGGDGSDGGDGNGNGGAELRMARADAKNARLELAQAQSELARLRQIVAGAPGVAPEKRKSSSSGLFAGRRRSSTSLQASEKALLKAAAQLAELRLGQSMRRTSPTRHEIAHKKILK